jgi:tRNA A64-2'-O-ribosylphosphate transferase
MAESGYIQGAGDDSESWSHGLSPPLFWGNKKALMNTAEDSLPGLIATILEKDNNVIVTSKAIPIKPTDWLFAATFDTLRSTEVSDTDLLVTCGEASQTPPFSIKEMKRIHLECRKGKLGSRDLRQQLSNLIAFLSGSRSFSRLYVGCPTGKDLSIGVILTILCLYTTDDGKKSLIRKINARQKLTSRLRSYLNTTPKKRITKQNFHQTATKLDYDIIPSCIPIQSNTAIRKRLSLQIFGSGSRASDISTLHPRRSPFDVCLGTFPLPCRCVGHAP